MTFAGKSEKATCLAWNGLGACLGIMCKVAPASSWCLGNVRSLCLPGRAQSVQGSQLRSGLGWQERVSLQPHP